MPYAEHLVEQAKHLANREKKRPRQASLRRAVSTAYYALFHLLIHEATLNWKRVGQRARLARLFEHGKMKSACEKQRAACTRYTGQDLDLMDDLYKVTDTFLQSQQERHSADYDNAKVWTRTEVLTLIQLVEAAFDSWKHVREHDDAQAFLVTLLGSPEGFEHAGGSEGDPETNQETTNHRRNTGKRRKALSWRGDQGGILMATVPGTRTNAGETAVSIFKGNPLWILSLLFFATTINYLDRAILGVLLPKSVRICNLARKHTATSSSGSSSPTASVR